MQNKAQWLESNPAGYKVRVGFQPANPAEADRCKELLQNCSVIVTGVSTGPGPMSIDLQFLPKAIAKIPAEPVATVPKANIAKDATSPSSSDAGGNAANTESQVASSTKKESIQ